jgi:hypothetical protein
MFKIIFCRSILSWNIGKFRTEKELFLQESSTLILYHL